MSIARGRGWLLWVAVLLPFAVFAAVWLIMAMLVERVHVWAAFPIAVVAAIGAAGGVLGLYQTSWIEKVENPAPDTSFIVTLSISVTCVLLVVQVGAWLSLAASRYGLTATADGVAPTFDSLVRAYLWHLVDTIPLANVAATFGQARPEVVFTGWAGGLPVLAFRLFVIAIVLSILRLSWENFTAASERALLERLRKRAAAPSS